MESINERLLIDESLNKTNSFLKETLLEKRLNKINHLDDFSKEWYESKKHFIDLFGGKTKIETTINEIDRSYFLSIVEDFKNKIMIDKTNIKLFFNFLTNSNHEVIKGFYRNEVILEAQNCNYFKCLCRVLKIDVKRTTGMKLSKLFIHVLRSCIDDENEVNDISQKFSEVINQFKISSKEQTVVLSCDLVDYLSMSHGHNGWKSCSYLFYSHGQGSLSYALDNHTLIAYIKDDNNPFKKKWRQVVYTDIKTGLAIGSRHYPYVVNSAGSTACEMWQDVYSKNRKHNYFKVSKDKDEFIGYINVLGDFAHMDIREFGMFEGFWCAYIDKDVQNEIHICKEEIMCLCCGEKIKKRVHNGVFCLKCRQG